MAKVTLIDLGNLQNEENAVGAININNARIETAIEDTLSRDGTSPNQMESTFDMNSHRIINLPTPISNTEPLRLQDLLDFTGGTLDLTDGATAFTELTDTPTSYSGQANKTVTVKTNETGLEFTEIARSNIFFNIVDYGAVGDASTDCTSAIQDAIDAAALVHGTVYIPASANGFKVIGAGASVFTVTAAMNFIGEGTGSLIYVDPSVPNTRNIFTVNIGTSSAGVSFKNFAINNFATGSGKRGIAFDSVNDLINVEVSGMIIFELGGGESIYVKNVAYGSIHDCNLESILVEGGGDGIHIHSNVIGTTTGSRPAIKAGFNAGAGGFTVRDNVIAALAGHIIITDGVGVVIDSNELETPIGVPNTYGFMVDIGTTSTTLCPRLTNNGYSVLAGTSNPVAIRIRGNCLNAYIGEAKILNQTGVHIQVDASAADTYIDRNCQFYTNAVLVEPGITNNGTRTGAMWRAADGSSTLPGFAFLSDSNTGMFSVGADSIGWSTGGTQRMTLSATELTVNASVAPQSNDGGSVGVSGRAVSDLFLASGAVINWNAGDVTETHSSNVLTWAGASGGYLFDSQIQVPIIVGGTAVGSDLILRTTTGTGDGTDYVIFQRGTNGATEMARMGKGSSIAGLALNTTTISDNSIRFGASVSAGAGMQVDTNSAGSNGTGLTFTAGASGSGTDKVGGPVSFVPGAGTGAGASAETLSYSYIPVASGTGAQTLVLSSNGNSGNFIVGNTGTSHAAVATNAANGFLYISSCNGTPTGTPTSYTGHNAVVYDTSANKIWVYNGSWRGVAVT